MMDDQPQTSEIPTRLAGKMYKVIGQSANNTASSIPDHAYAAQIHKSLGAVIPSRPCVSIHLPGVVGIGISLCWWRKVVWSRWLEFLSLIIHAVRVGLDYFWQQRTTAHFFAVSRKLHG